MMKLNVDILSYYKAFYLNPMVKYWIYPQIYWNTIILNPDRFVAFLGVLLGAFGVIATYSDTLIDTPSFQIALFLASISIPSLTFLSIMNEPKNHAEALSRNMDFSELIRITAYQSSIIIGYINARHGEAARKAIGRTRNQVRTIEELYLRISERSKIDCKIIAEDLFDFHPGIFINRHTRRAVKEISGSVDHTQIIYENSGKTLAYQKRLENTKFNLNWLEIVFRARSNSAAIEYFIQFLEKYGANIEDYDLIVHFQRPYSSGVIADRMLGLLLISAFLDKDGKKLDTYVARAKLITGFKDNAEPAFTSEKQIRAVLNGWYKESEDLIKNQRAEIWDKLYKQLMEMCLETPDKRVYFVFKDYSRAVQKIIRFFLDSAFPFSHEIFVNIDNGNDDEIFGSRIFFHKTKNETSSRFKPNIWKGDAEAFSSQICEKTSRVVFICGCEEIENNNSAYLSYPQSDLENFRKNKNIQVDVFVIGGAYKLKLDYLVDIMSSKSPLVHSQIREVVDYYLESMHYVKCHSYRWISNESIKIHVVTSDLVPFGIAEQEVIREPDKTV